MKTRVIQGGFFLFLSFSLSAATRYVDLNCPSPTPPFTNWPTAATNIQDALDYSTNGDFVLVTNGVYETGGRALEGTITNRVAVTNQVTLMSMNGPAVTAIRGYQVPGTTNGEAAVRCVFLANGASLSGFVLTNGATGENDDDLEASGGGVWCESASCVVSNCVLAGNAARNSGGGGFGGTLVDCIIRSNTASMGGGLRTTGFVSRCLIVGNSASTGGGIFSPGEWPMPSGRISCCVILSNSARDYGGGIADYFVATDCLIKGNSAFLGGGVSDFGGPDPYLTNCTLVANTAGYYGGGASECILVNCKVVWNSVTNSGFSAGYGGGAYSSTLLNCTVVGNKAKNGGGANTCWAYNSILYCNTVTDLYHISSSNSSAMFALDYCCSSPIFLEPRGSITNRPLFVDLEGGNFRLQSNSPCINAGTNLAEITAVDMDGRPRLVGGKVDIGAYEYQGPGTGEFFGWLEQFGLPRDGLADFLDPDADGMNNWREWRCLTDPTNTLSALKLLTPSGGVSGVSVSWSSVTNRTYWLERSTNLGAAPAFTLLATNLLGVDGTKTYLDSTAVGGGPFLYRVGVQP